MNDDGPLAEQIAGRQARESDEAALVSLRILQLRNKPVQGAFDLAHLKAIHAHIFQDLPHHRPGIVRSDTDKSWIKHRTLEEEAGVYSVGYIHKGVAARLRKILKDFGGPKSIKGLPLDAAAKNMALLYGGSRSRSWIL